MTGFLSFLITSPEMMQESTSFIEGTSYIISIIEDSRIDLNPLAPVFRLIAWATISWIAHSVNSKWTSSSLNNFWYCLVNAFLGSVRILYKAFSSNFLSGAEIGSLPISSGINPNLSKSSGWACKISWSLLTSIFLFLSNPIPVPFNLLLIIMKLLVL